VATDNGQENGRRRWDKEKRRALAVIAGAMAFGLVAIFVFSLTTRDASGFFAVLSNGLIIAAAATVVGSLLGFLFGVPRTLQVGDEPASGEGQPSVGYRANTNLEQISDWLTKILVGVGLTQLATVDTRLAALTAYLAPGLSSAAVTAPAVFVGSVLVFFACTGFLFAYLWTRLYLGPALRETDLSAIGALQERVDELQAQVTKDARAQLLASKQLDLDSEEVEYEELAKAITEASREARAKIFWDAYKQRAGTWRHQKPVMELTIPIFRALIESDKLRQYHMNFGQLGFALKDRQQPDWVTADKRLTEAIEIRGDWRETGWVIYEFNRAVTRIHLEADAGGTSPGFPKEYILEDLRIAAQADRVRDWITEEEIVQKWMSAHDVTAAQLREPPA